MRCETTKRGSALLIVLGMLAFMVISAVAFSAYMRAARLPSSYLRRVVASRMLVKAALAEAIDEIDAAVGNFPHPGVWMDPSSVSSGKNRGEYEPQNSETKYYLTRNTEHTDTDRNSNIWLGRVYIGNDSKDSKTKAQECMIPQYQTVPTLTLEALAYIPPPLVNEARYYSRHSNAGTWHTMGFDAGRYAFCAIDVSDYFDINALTAGNARNSSPSGRISLSYLFEPDDHGSAASQVANWDAFIGEYLKKVPLISVADWNLAMGSRTFGSIESYFCQYVGGNGNNFYNGKAGSDSGIDQIARMAFVTDGWFPPESNSSVDENRPTLDLSQEINQPFDPNDLKRGCEYQKQLKVWPLINYESQGKGMERLRTCIGGLGACALFDYLDEDDIPVSLALPTVERTPMFCGISPAMQGGKISIKPAKGSIVSCKMENGAQVGQGGECTVTYTIKYEIDGELPSPQIKTLVAFPFLRSANESEKNEYTIGGRAAYFLTVNGQGVGLRTNNSSDFLHLTYGKGDPGSFVDIEKSFDKCETIGKSVFSYPLKHQSGGFQPTTFTTSGKGEDAAVSEVILRSAEKGALTPTEFMEITYTWITKDVSQAMPGMPPPKEPDPLLKTPDIASADGRDFKASIDCKWDVIGKDGVVDKDFGLKEKKTTITEWLVSKSAQKIELNLNFAVWLWVQKKDGDKELVDLVPACVNDDASFNKRNMDDNFSGKWCRERLGNCYPIMRFDMGAGSDTCFTLDSTAAGSDGVLTGSIATEYDKKSVIVGDPRFNYAPESWFTVNEDLTKNTWLNNCGCRDRDGDIFMQTSDRCYLQSVFELANLLRFTDFYKCINGRESSWDDCEAGVYPAAKDSFAGSFSDAANSTYMWKTYDPFPTYRKEKANEGLEKSDPDYHRLDFYIGDNFYRAPFTSAGNGTKINPYTDNTNVMMAAFANTPINWHYSAVNDYVNLGLDDAQTFNSSFAWNGYNTCGRKLAWDDLSEVAGSFMDEMRAANGDSWEAVFATLGWYDENVTPQQKKSGEAPQYLLSDLQVSGDKIYNTDKKFLYGFWRECFDVKQQLFLIFVRAEPMLMGGGAVGQTPPQLGGRAMALVWRDPVNRSTQTLSPGGSGAKGGNSSGYTTGGASPHRTRILFYRQFD